MNTHTRIPASLDGILDEQADEATKASAAATGARIRAAFNKPRQTSVTTEDGTVIIHDPEVGTVSRRTKEEAEAEVRRRKGLKVAA